ncbi:MAG: putative PDDEXK endonuclease [archaeon]
MSNKSKIKGKTFEREISKYLSELYSESFRPVMNSGAYIGGKNNIRRQTLSENQIKSYKGDIVPPDDWKYFNCECKSYSDFPFHQLFNDITIPLLESWIEQLRETANPGDYNIIIMKFNRKGRYIMIEKNNLFEYEKYIQYKDKNGKIWIFMNLECFFKNNKEVFYKNVTG